MVERRASGRYIRHWSQRNLRRNFGSVITAIKPNQCFLRRPQNVVGIEWPERCSDECTFVPRFMFVAKIRRSQ